MCIAPNRRITPSASLAQLANQLAVKPADFNLAPFKASSSRKVSRSQRHHITVQHNYHDHASDVCCEAESRRLPARGGVVTPFPLKLHSMLEAVSRDGLAHVVSWQAHGRCFVVHDAKAFVSILEQYFKISKVSSFQRQLNLYGFQRLTKRQDKGGYYHELFLRGKVFLSHNIQRIKVKGTKIRARSNPDQEPNFYEMPFVQDAEQVNSDDSASSCQPAEPSMNALDSLIDISPDLWEVLPQESTPLEKISSTMWDDDDVLSFSEGDADAFLQDFDFPADSAAFKNIEDDNVFGELLEQIISSWTDCSHVYSVVS